MAKKRKKPEFKRPPTKRQLSTSRRHQRQQHIILIVAGVFFASVLGFVGYGYYDDQVRPLRQPIVRINDTVLDMGYYLEALDLFTGGQETSVVSLMADMTVQTLERNELVRQGAPDLGISVTAEEIDSKLEEFNVPDDEVNRDLVGAQLLTDRLLSDYFDPKVPAACDQVQVQAVFVESEQAAERVIDELGATDNFTALAAEFTTEAVTKEKSGDLGWLPKGFIDIVLPGLSDSLLEEIAFGLEPGELSEPTYDESITKGIGYWLIEVLERDEENGSHARGILLGSRQEAEAVKVELEAGEDFATLVQEYSRHWQSKATEGDLGWLQRESASKPVVEAAFSLEPGVVSEPLADESAPTQGGYWLVKAVDKDDNRQLEDDTREAIKSKAFEDWLNERREKSTIENYLDAEQKSWAVARILRDRE